MEINVDIQPDCTATLKASIPAETTAARRASIVDSYAGKAKLPGFRPAKRPSPSLKNVSRRKLKKNCWTLFLKRPAPPLWKKIPN